MKRLYSYMKENIGITLTDIQIKQFEIFYEMLIEKNKVMNLTAITERDEVELKHFIDSVALGSCMDLKKNNISIIDVGTGAGFPGIPLKIAFPNINIVLFDSLNKRVKFLQEVIDELKLNGEDYPESSVGFCKAVHGRAEDGGRDKNYREKFDIVLSRAVANMAVLSEYCIPFVKQGGYFIPYKTGTVDEELSQGKKSISILGGKTEKVEKIILPGTDIGRSFVFIKKIKETPKAYPRKAGTASKQPLI